MCTIRVALDVRGAPPPAVSDKVARRYCLANNPRSSSCMSARSHILSRLPELLVGRGRQAVHAGDGVVCCDLYAVSSYQACAAPINLCGKLQYLDLGIAVYAFGSGVLAADALPLLHVVQQTALFQSDRLHAQPLRKPWVAHANGNIVLHVLIPVIHGSVFAVAVRHPLIIAIFPSNVHFHARSQCTRVKSV
jgi:hypothetical protein